MAALSYSHNGTRGGVSHSRTALMLSIAVFLIWGVGGIFIQLALDVLPLIAYLGLCVFILPPIAGTYLRHKGASVSIFRPKWAVPVIGAIVLAELWQLGYFAETSAVSQGAESIVFPLISAYPVVTILGARLFLKERLSKRDWAILACVIVGIALVSVP